MALQDDVRNLASLPAFRDLDPEAVRLFVVLSGAIGVEDATGRETLVRAPALLGEMALVAETLRPATAIAREPTSVLKVPRVLYRRILAEYPDSAARVRAAVAARLFTMRRDLEGLRRTMGVG